VGSESVYLFNINGTKLWDHPIGTPITAVTTNGKFVVASSGMKIYTFLINGTPLWTKDLGENNQNTTTNNTITNISSVVTYDFGGTTYIGYADDSGNICFYYPDGSVAWSYKVNEPITTMIVKEPTYEDGVQIQGYVVVGGKNGGIYIFDLNGNLKYEFKDIKDTITALCIYKDYLISGTFKGKVYLMKLLTGDILNVYNANSTVKSLSGYEDNNGEWILAECEDGEHKFPITVNIKRPDLTIEVGKLQEVILVNFYL